MSRRRRPSHAEQAKMARLFAPFTPLRVPLCSVMQHKVGTCEGAGRCPLCPPPAVGPVKGSAA
jgi:hypothetical protein